MLDTSVTTAHAPSPASTDPEPPLPTELLANVLTDDQRVLIVAQEGVEEVADQLVALMQQSLYKNTDLARAIRRMGSDPRVRCSAVRESLRALLRKQKATSPA